MYLQEQFSKTSVKWKASLWIQVEQNEIFPQLMHVQLHLKDPWKDSMKLLPVLTLERGLGLGLVVGGVKDI